MPNALKYQVNERVGDWQLLRYQPGSDRKGKPRVKSAWFCVCTCGAIRWVRADNLLNGSSRSCGHRDPKNAHFSSLNVPPVSSVFNLGWL